MNIGRIYLDLRLKDILTQAEPFNDLARVVVKRNWNKLAVGVLHLTVITVKNWSLLPKRIFMTGGCHVTSGTMNPNYARKTDEAMCTCDCGMPDKFVA